MADLVITERSKLVAMANAVRANSDITDDLTIDGIADGVNYVAEYVVASLPEEKTVELDFSAGDMEVLPSEGKMLTKVGIPMPTTLVPENIAKDVSIAGVVGTMESGGGQTPYIFCMAQWHIYKGKTSEGSYRLLINETLPPGSTVIYACFDGYGNGNALSATAMGTSGYVNNATPTISKSSSGVIVSLYKDVTYGNYYLKGYTATIMYTLPGVYLMTDADGAYMYADETVTAFPTRCVHRQDLVRADLRNSNIAELAKSAFNGVPIPEILLPPTLVNIGSNALYGDGINVLDFSAHTSVPNLNYTDSISYHDNLEIRVPSALYDEWIAATNWSAYADYIVAV